MVKNRFLKNSSFYLFSTIINSGLVFLLTPVMAYIISPEEMGKVAIFQSITVFLYSIVGLGSNSATVRYSYDVDDNKLGEYIGSSLIILLSSTIVVFAFICISSGYLSNWLGLDESWLYFSLFIASFNYFFLLLLGLYQRRENAKKYAFLQIGNGLINFILSIFLVYFLYQTGDGRIFGWVISIAATGFISIYILHKRYDVRFRAEANIGKRLFRYGVPLIPHELGTFLITWLAMIIVKEKLDLASVGIFLVSLQLSSVLGVVCDAANKAYVPWLFGKLKQESVDKVKIVKMTYIAMFGLILVSTISFVLSPITMPMFLPREYANVAEIFIVLVFGQAFGGMYLLVTNYIFFSKKTKVLPYITVLSGIVNFCLLYYLIDSFGLVGAAYAFTISRFVQFILTWIAACVSYPMPWSLKLLGADFGHKTN
ncbi:flippase [Vibrio hepatarius]|uniref:flippase n=1 Tax=Vibrio hepatarius TaxID=171383 RepID=UPI00142E38CC|nr:flippase [Vibrio hepatarius]NIY83310.1 flippase [Vibrio hepatarius]